MSQELTRELCPDDGVFLKKVASRLKGHWWLTHNEFVRLLRLAERRRSNGLADEEEDMPDEAPAPNPEDYPFSLLKLGDEVWLRIRNDPSGKFGVLVGRDLPAQLAFDRYEHMLEAHGRESANIFMWGFITGMQSGAATRIREILNEHETHRDRVKL